MLLMGVEKRPDAEGFEVVSPETCVEAIGQVSNFNDWNIPHMSLLARY